MTEKEIQLEKIFHEVRFNSSSFIIKNKSLTEPYLKAIPHLIAATKLANQIYLEQLSPAGSKLIKDVENQLKNTSDDGEKIILERRLRLLKLHAGPYAPPTDQNFLPGETDSAPEEAALYPVGTTKEIFQAYLDSHPDQKDSLLNIATVVVSDGKGGYNAVPYSVYYKKWYDPLCAEVDKAAAILKPTEPELADYLSHRAQSLRTNADLYESDMKWMKLPPTLPIDFCFGPIETYIDRLFNQKGAWQSVVFIRDAENTQKLEHFKDYLNILEVNIPLDPKYRSVKGGGDAVGASAADTGENNSRIELFYAAYLGGESASPSYTLAHNLPNDERVTSQFGNRNQFYLNIQAAKMEIIVRPLSKIFVSTAFLPHVTPAGFFNHVLLHELSHTLGPSYLHNNPAEGKIKPELKELYATIEECKADTLSMFAHGFIGQAEERKKEADSSYVPILSQRDVLDSHVSHFASMVRTIRFGIGSDHAKGCTIQLNWLIAHGAIFFDAAEKKYAFDFTKWDAAVASLGKELLEIKTYGDYARAQKLLKDFGSKLPEETVALLKQTEGVVPIDLAVYFDE